MTPKPTKEDHLINSIKIQDLTLNEVDLIKKHAGKPLRWFQYATEIT